MYLHMNLCLEQQKLEFKTNLEEQFLRSGKTNGQESVKTSLSLRSPLLFPKQKNNFEYILQNNKLQIIDYFL